MDVDSDEYLDGDDLAADHPLRDLVIETRRVSAGRRSERAYDRKEKAQKLLFEILAAAECLGSDVLREKVLEYKELTS
jgi:hypothetical protein